MHCKETKWNGWLGTTSCPSGAVQQIHLAELQVILLSKQLVKSQFENM